MERVSDSATAWYVCLWVGGFIVGRLADLPAYILHHGYPALRSLGGPGAWRKPADYWLEYRLRVELALPRGVLQRPLLVAPVVRTASKRSYGAYNHCGAPGRYAREDQRMRVTQPTPKGRKAPQVGVSHRLTDVAGILLLALAVVAMLALFLSDTGVIGAALARVLASLFGRGAWAMPIVIALLGASALSGRKLTGLRHATWGLASFLALSGPSPPHERGTSSIRRCCS